MWSPRRKEDLEKIQKAMGSTDTQWHAEDVFQRLIVLHERAEKSTTQPLVDTTPATRAELNLVAEIATSGGFSETMFQKPEGWTQLRRALKADLPNQANLVPFAVESMKGLSWDLSVSEEFYMRGLYYSDYGRCRGLFVRACHDSDNWFAALGVIEHIHHHQRQKGEDFTPSLFGSEPQALSLAELMDVVTKTRWMHHRLSDHLFMDLATRAFARRIEELRKLPGPPDTSPLGIERTIQGLRLVLMRCIELEIRMGVRTTKKHLRELLDVVRVTDIPYDQPIAQMLHMWLTDCLKHPRQPVRPLHEYAMQSDHYGAFEVDGYVVFVTQPYRLHTCKTLFVLEQKTNFLMVCNEEDAEVEFDTPSRCMTISLDMTTRTSADLQGSVTFRHTFEPNSTWLRENLPTATIWSLNSALGLEMKKAREAVKSCSK